MSASSPITPVSNSNPPFTTKESVKKLNIALILLLGPLGAALFFGGPVTLPLVIVGGGGLIGYASVYNSKTHPMAGIILGVFLSLLPAILLGSTCWGTLINSLYQSSTLIIGVGAFFGTITLISAASAYYYHTRF